MFESEGEAGPALDVVPDAGRTGVAVVAHLHLILLACALWLAACVAAVLRAPLSALFDPATIAQALVCGYGVLLYSSWLMRRPSPFLRPLFWWLPQTFFLTVFAFDPATKTLGAPLAGFSAAMPLQISATVGWHLARSSVAISLNFLALAGIGLSLWRPYPAGSDAERIQAPVSRARRVLRNIVVGTPVLLLLAAAGARVLGVKTWIQRAPPPGLDHVTLSSGKVVQVYSVAPVTFADGGSLLLLEYFTELPSSEQGDRLAGEAAEVWERFRPFAETSGYRFAVIAASPKPATAVYVVAPIKKFAWTRGDDGAWREYVAEAPGR